MNKFINWLTDIGNFIVWYPTFTCLAGMIVGYFMRKIDEKERH